MGQPHSATGHASTVAGFIVWLSGEQWPAEQRYQFVEVVERFLRRPAGEPLRRGPAFEQACRDYLQLRQEQGASVACLANVRTALDLLGRYAATVDGALDD